MFQPTPRGTLTITLLSILLCPLLSHVCNTQGIRLMRPGRQFSNYYRKTERNSIHANTNNPMEGDAIRNAPLFREDLTRSDSSSLLESEVCDYCILTALAAENIALGNYEQAVRQAKDAIKTAEHTHQQNNIYVANADGICADALYAIGEFEESAKHYRKALKSYEINHNSNRDPEALKLVGATHLIAHNFLTQNCFEEAAEAWSKALGMTERLLGPKNVNVAGCMANLAISHIKLGDLGPAPEGLLKRALQIYREQKAGTFDAESDSHPDNIILNNGGSPTATVCSELGNLYLKRGDNNQAAQNYRVVQELYHLGAVDFQLAADSIESLGIIRWSEGLRNIAQNLLEEAIQIRQKAAVPETELGNNSYLLLDAFHRGENPPSRISGRWDKIIKQREENDWKKKNISY